MSQKLLMPTSPVIPERPELYEVQIAKQQEEYLTLPTHVTHDAHCVTRWQPTPEQRAQIAAGADICVIVQAPVYNEAWQGFPPVSVFAGSPEWLLQASDPQGNDYTLPAPVLKAEVVTPSVAKLELQLAPGTRLADVGRTVFVISEDEAGHDARIPLRAPGVYPVLTLAVDRGDGRGGLEAGRPHWVRAYLAPAEGRSLLPSAYSEPVCVTFPRFEDAQQPPPAEGDAGQGEAVN